MPDLGLQLLRSNLSGITQINLMVEALIRNIQLITLLYVMFIIAIKLFFANRETADRLKNSISSLL